MKLLAEITEATAGIAPHGSELLGESYQLRKSARAILLNDAGLMATQYLANHTYHKLPGGGVEVGESIEAALRREVREEVGCDCTVGQLVGMTIEYRNTHQLLHLSYCYVAQVVGDIGVPQLEPGEIEEGQETLWLTPADALARMQTDATTKYTGHFILAREQAFLKEFLESHQ